MQWTLSIAIDWKRDGKVTARPFSVEKTCQKETEAGLHGIADGQLIIDGQVPEFLVGERSGTPAEVKMRPHAKEGHRSAHSSGSRDLRTRSGHAAELDS